MKSLYSHRYGFGLLALVGSAALALSVDSVSATVISENFNDLNNDTSLTTSSSGWKATTNGLQITSQTSAESPFTSADPGLGVVILDTLVDKGNSTAIYNPLMMDRQPLQISFDYIIYDSGANNLVPTLRLSPTGLDAQFGMMVKLWENGSLTYMSGNPINSTTVLQTINLDTWYHVDIDIALDDTRDTFDLSITPYGGTTATYNDLTFRSQVDNYDDIRFYMNNGHDKTGSMAVDNIVVTPEPTSLGVLALTAAPLMLRRKRSVSK